MRKAAADSAQLSFGAFDVDFDAALIAAAECLSRKITKSRYSREQMADLVTALLGRKLTAARLNDWLAPANRNRMPADVLVACCYILGDFEPLDILLAVVGRVTADKRDQAFADLGRIQLERESLKQQEDRARAILKREG